MLELLAIFVMGQAGPAPSLQGQWVGTQSWAIENPPPAIQGDHEGVRLILELKDGQLQGLLVPFLGGVDGAVFYGAQFEDGGFSASARIGPEPDFASSTDLPELVPQNEGGEDPDGRSAPGSWKQSLAVLLEFEQTDVDHLVGLATVKMGEVDWLKFSYDLERQR